MGGYELLHRVGALAAGIDDYDLARMRRRNELHTIRPGVYTRERPVPDTDAEQLARILAALAKTGRPAAVSHVSAALLHGLAVWNIDRSLVHMTRRGSGGGHASTRRRLHTAPLDPADVTYIGGIPVTTVARTVVDLARSEDFTHGAVVGDCALNNALTCPDELHDALSRCRGMAGCRRARAVLDALDQRCESPGETRARLLMDKEGLPRPELQRVIRHGGVSLGRVDFYFADHGIVGEFDGKAKYTDPEYSGGDPAEVKWREKRREDRLADRGFVIVRWAWEDLSKPDVFRALFETARRRAGAMPPPRIDPPNPADEYRPRRRVRPLC